MRRGRKRAIALLAQEPATAERERGTAVAGVHPLDTGRDHRSRNNVFRNLNHALRSYRLPPVAQMLVLIHPPSTLRGQFALRPCGSFATFNGAHRAAQK